VALTLEQLAQSPAEINAYLRSLRDGAAQKQLNRVRALFIGHGGVGKTSLINALHGEDVVEGREAMTKRDRHRGLVESPQWYGLGR
jgi:putative ribosome biogenesis GTPase RsgA